MGSLAFQYFCEFEMNSQRADKRLPHMRIEINHFIVGIPFSIKALAARFAILAALGFCDT